ncbi:MAG: DUF1318 domain-containing protein [Candidatus Auribacter fodinae]|jgi:uncharacterized protein YdbL (DUF1318 family)|uniref:DUF1318 domain-containing protein n=1 Tax=Candidatus Auribacter fodinae TaxID=2093366 RepID=A0A3A4RF54_9BACT|nr:MAG: DUF1318 domain-containing protein [Candidatus Auribacter fodinae]
MKPHTIAMTMLIAGTSLCLYIGCTQHNIKVEQDEPFRVDVNMRIDVYQHTVEHANTIEDLINSGAQPQSFNFFELMDTLLFGSPAYAQSGSIVSRLSEESKTAIANRQNRRAELVSWQQKGIIGENALGFVTLYNKSVGSPTLQQLIQAENADRTIIYNNLAQIEGANPEEIGKVYATQIQQNAPSGTPIEVYDRNSGKNNWQIK